jgi:hypothetical protein
MSDEGKNVTQLSTRYVTTVTVIDPDSGGEVEVEIRKIDESGAMVGIDGSYLEQDVGEVNNPYGDGELCIPYDEE